MADTIRLRFVPQEGKDYGPQAVRDPEGYEFPLGPNQTQVVPVIDPRTLRMAGNATVALGQPSQQLDAPEVVVDNAEQPAIV